MAPHNEQHDATHEASMANRTKLYQPGVILHQVIDGCLRANGSSFARWCNENDVAHGAGRNATYGISSGPRGQEIVEAMIASAGRAEVIAAYSRRMQLEAEKLRGTAA